MRKNFDAHKTLTNMMIKFVRHFHHQNFLLYNTRLLASIYTIWSVFKKFWFASTIKRQPIMLNFYLLCFLTMLLIHYAQYYA